MADAGRSAGGSAGGNVALSVDDVMPFEDESLKHMTPEAVMYKNVKPKDPYKLINNLFNRCKEDVRKTIASSIAVIEEYLESLSPNNKGKTRIPSPDKLDSALRSIKTTSENVCLNDTEKKEFNRLMRHINNEIEAKYANALYRSLGGRRKSRKSRSSKSKKKSRR
jgi:hypothetical protein